MLKLAQEPQEVIEKLRKPHVLDPIGWFDTPFYSTGNKGSSAYHSFFARYPRETIIFPEDPKLEEESKNVWPDTIPNFKSDFVTLNKSICETLVNLLYHFDKYLNKNIKGYDFNMTKEIGNNNYVNTSRTIVYKPLPKQDMEQDWDHWHTDYGMFSTVAKPVYFSKDLKRLEFNNTSFNFKDRQGNIHEASFKNDEMLVTISDTMFILSAGLFPTTPHCVKAVGVPRDIYRLNHVSFFEPQYNHRMRIPTGESFPEIIEKDPLKFYYRSTNNYKDGLNYKEFNELVLSLLINNQMK